MVRKFGGLKFTVPVRLNSTLAIGGVSSPLDSFVVAESSVLRTKFCVKIALLRQAQKRYRAF